MRRPKTAENRYDAMLAKRTPTPESRSGVRAIIITPCIAPRASAERFTAFIHSNTINRYWVMWASAVSGPALMSTPI